MSSIVILGTGLGRSRDSVLSIRERLVPTNLLAGLELSRDFYIISQVLAAHGWRGLVLSTVVCTLE